MSFPTVDDDRTEAQARLLQLQADELKPNGTKLSYDPKIREFKEYCNALYGDTDFPAQVTERKFFDFLYFQAFRSKRNGRKKRKEPEEDTVNDAAATGGSVAAAGVAGAIDGDDAVDTMGNKRKNENTDNENMNKTGNNATNNDKTGTTKGNGTTKGKRAKRSAFDIDEFRSVTKAITGKGRITEEVLKQHNREASGKLKLCGCSVKLYQSAIKSLYREQRSNQTNSISEDRIDSQRIKNLIYVVTHRKAKEKHDRYEERMDFETSPFRTAERIEDIELIMWNKMSSITTVDLAELRHRFVWLFTFASMLRGESVFKGELADLFQTDQQGPNEPHPYEFLVITIDTGKTNRAHNILGRVLRHKDPNMCSFGALGFYLFARFAYTGELSRYDFGDNRSWFDAKILISSRGIGPTMPLTTLTDRIDYTQYGDEIGKVCEQLGLLTNHFVHLGRKQGSIALQFKEVCESQIKLLGNWNMDVHSTAYSSGFPLEALRASAGFNKEEGSHYSPRTEKDPPEELKKLVFPELEGIEAHVKKRQQEMLAATQRRKSARAKNTVLPLSTALGFLNLLHKLRRVILQDAAAMISAGRTNPLFEFPVFKSQLFIDYTNDMKNHLAATKGNTPRLELLQRAMPAVREGFATMQQMQSGFQFQLQEMERRMTEQAEQRHNELLVELQKFQQSFSTYSNMQNNPLQQIVNIAAAAGVTSPTGAEMGHRHNNDPMGTSVTNFANNNINNGISTRPSAQNIPQYMEDGRTAVVPVVPPARASVGVGLSVEQVIAQHVDQTCRYTPSANYSSVAEIWNEWEANKIFEREGDLTRRKRAGWREYFSKLEKKRFDRAKKIIIFVQKLRDREGSNLQVAFVLAEQKFSENGRKLANMETYLSQLMKSDPELRSLPGGQINESVHQV